MCKNVYKGIDKYVKHCYYMSMNTIKRTKTYSSKEAAELLGMNINTFQRFAREGKIKVYRTGKNYRITGAALLDHMGIAQQMSRPELIEELNKAVEQLIPILRREKKDLGVFLHQSIAIHADETSIEKIIADINRYISLSEKNKEA
jgi:excisionase family DNA binding protein